MLAEKWAWEKWHTKITPMVFLSKDIVHILKNRNIIDYIKVVPMGQNDLSINIERS